MVLARIRSKIGRTRYLQQKKVNWIFLANSSFEPERDQRILSTNTDNIQLAIKKTTKPIHQIIILLSTGTLSLVYCLIIQSLLVAIYLKYWKVIRKIYPSIHKRIRAAITKRINHMERQLVSGYLFYAYFIIKITTKTMWIIRAVIINAFLIFLVLTSLFIKSSLLLLVIYSCTIFISKQKKYAFIINIVVAMLSTAKNHVEAFGSSSNPYNL